MYICVCNAVTERQIRQAVDNGVATLSELRATLGVGNNCRSCEDLAEEIIRQRLSENAANDENLASREL
ncbi:MAG TPA: (2Fe-2S)-binding protein [Gammaproteobacteria bacterium]|nr:(2Fe-2S)-binding protein [Gammaproteobacteria bacterium]